MDEIRVGETYADVAPFTPGTGQPSVSIARSGSQIQITWSGSALLGASTVTGNWNTIQGALSPVHSEAIGSTNKFFRAQQ